MTPAPAYILCATPRTGSTLLCAHLHASGVAGHPQSLFRREDMQDYAAEWRITGPGGRYGFADFLNAAITEGRGGTSTFGLRLMWETLAELIVHLGGAAEPRQADLLQEAFGPLRYVYLWRRDLVAQAISRHKAEVSGIWHIGIEESTNPATPQYDYNRIDHHVRAADASNQSWKNWFTVNRIAPLSLCYEDLSVNPDAAARCVLNFLGLPSSTGRPNLPPNRKMADAESAAWQVRYLSERKSRGD